MDIKSARELAEMALARDGQGERLHDIHPDRQTRSAAMKKKPQKKPQKKSPSKQHHQKTIHLGGKRGSMKLTQRRGDPVLMELCVRPPDGLGWESVEIDMEQAREVGEFLLRWAKEQ